MRVKGYAPNLGVRHSTIETRLIIMGCLLTLGGLGLAARLFQLQVLQYNTFRVLASDQHEIQSALIPRRGTIYLRDRNDATLYPAAKDRDAWLVYVMPREVKDAAATTREAAAALQQPEADLLLKIAATSSYAILSKDAPFSAVEILRDKHLSGIGLTKGQARLYPEQGLGGQFLGFTNTDDNNVRSGKYGLEGFEDKLLAGEAGTLLAEKDAAGRIISLGRLELKEAKNGSDIILTLDRAIQYEACAEIQRAVKFYGATGGSIVVMDPSSGAILAMCSAPDFEPSDYGNIGDLSVLNNPATFYQFEPGSVFKAFTMAAGLDAGKITPNTTYTDPGEEKIDDFTIRNSDKLAHGVQTMTQVLEKSLNTGTIFVQRLLGKDVFREYLTRFGFGSKTGIEQQSEAKGDLSPLTKPGKVFAATASFGQGISVTPIQLVAGYGALANGGKLMKPYLVQEIIHPDNSREVTKPEVVSQVVSPRSARLVTGMLVSVVENGHGKKAAVPGYYVAGKTGTAQIPNPRGKGYLDGQSIGSFIGYAPAENPKFVMLVKIDRPKIEGYAESSAAPVFGEMAKFLLSYLAIQPERPIINKPEPPPLPVAASSTNSAR